jgi:Rrf2 family protein
MLSQRGRYALKAMLHLARSEGAAPRQAAAIAEAEAIPRKFLEAILTDLVRHGLVQSVRGRHGGFRLARPAEAITFGEVIRLTDGPLALLPCVSKVFYERCEDCTDEATCALRRVMAEVREQVAGLLDSRTIADAIRDGWSGDEDPSRQAA